MKRRVGRVMQLGAAVGYNGGLDSAVGYNGGLDSPRSRAGSDETVRPKRNPLDNTLHRQVKTHTKLEKVITAYCTKKAIEPTAVRFVFEGARVNPNSTPQDLGMDDGDSIDVFQEQVGGI